MKKQHSNSKETIDETAVHYQDGENSLKEETLMNQEADSKLKEFKYQFLEKEQKPLNNLRRIENQQI